MDYDDLALELHEKYKGKMTLALRDNSELNEELLSAYYTPGVAAVSRAIADDPNKLPLYSWTNNLVAVISDGSAVLGLGDIGPKASMPVMEGKALLFKHFAGIDSVPIILDVHTPDEIVAVIKAIAPSFGAINLEDIAAPKCFEIEDRLRARLDIPVFHDDQHGTAIVVLAGLINAMKVVGKKLENTKIVLIGAGAAGVAIAKLLYQYATPDITAVDSQGIIDNSRVNLSEEKRYLASLSNRKSRGSHLREALKGADVVIGVSRAGILGSEDIAVMNKQPIVFALANPTPEIMPEDAKKAGVAVIATGRSDFPNQVNNALAFPGIFKGALGNKVKRITNHHKIAAAQAIAGLIDHPDADYIIPSVFDKRLVPSIARVII